MEPGGYRPKRGVATAWWRVLVVGLVLSAALGWMVFGQVRILRNGREIVLQTRPIDPRDLLLGHYARLGYEISRIPAKKVDGLQEWCWKHKRLHGRRILVALQRGKDGYWHFAGASLRGMAAMKDGIAPADAVIVAGRVRSSFCGGTLRVEYGIERFYAPKEKALKLERLARRRNSAERRSRIGVIVRVGTNGKPVIAGLMIDGKRIYEEPLF